MKGYGGLVLVIISLMVYPGFADEHIDQPHSHWVQDEATSGTFEESGNGSYTLILGGLDESAVHYTDYPYPKADVIPFGADSCGSCWAQGSVDAVIKIANPDSDDKETLMATLSDPEFNNESGTVSYTAVPIMDQKELSENLQPFAVNADPVLPQSFGETSVYYDGGMQENDANGVEMFDCGNHYVDCYDQSSGKYYGSATAGCYWHLTCEPNPSDDYSACKGRYGQDNEYRVEQKTACHYK